MTEKNKNYVANNNIKILICVRVYKYIYYFVKIFNYHYIKRTDNF